MDMQDKPGFENEWLQAFQDAEADISENVWDKIELGIANSANGKMKRRVVFLQLLAAASVVFALSVTGIATYNWFVDKNSDFRKNGISANNQPSENNFAITDSKPDNNAQISPDRTTTQVQLNDKIALSERPKDNINAVIKKNSGKMAQENATGKERHAALKGNKKIEQEDTAGKDEYAALKGNKKIAGTKIDHDRPGKGTVITDSKSPKSNELDITGTQTIDLNELVAGANRPVDEVKAKETEGLEGFSKVAKLFEFLKTDSLAKNEMIMVPWYAYVPKKEGSNRGSQDIWAGVDFSAGRFDPNTGNVNNSADLAQMAFEGSELKYKRTPSFGEERVGQSMHVGVNVGTKIAKRWIVQSGIGYLQQQTASTSNVVAAPSQNAKTVASFNSLDYSSTDKIGTIENIEFTQPYEIVNTYELFTVPLQAGYIILDQKLNITLLTGVSNNILLKNKFESQSDDLENLSVNAGGESLYKTYQISGLFGSEFSYTIDEHYIVSVLPQLRQSINSITKSDTDFDSRPTILEVGFRFKYIFN